MFEPGRRAASRSNEAENRWLLRRDRAGLFRHRTYASQTCLPVPVRRFAMRSISPWDRLSIQRGNARRSPICSSGDQVSARTQVVSKSSSKNSRVTRVACREKIAAFQACCVPTRVTPKGIGVPSISSQAGTMRPVSDKAELRNRSTVGSQDTSTMVMRSWLETTH